MFPDFPYRARAHQCGCFGCESLDQSWPVMAGSGSSSKYELNKVKYQAQSLTTFWSCFGRVVMSIPKQSSGIISSHYYVVKAYRIGGPDLKNVLSYFLGRIQGLFTIWPHHMHTSLYMFQARALPRPPLPSPFPAPPPGGRGRQRRKFLKFGARISEIR